MNTTTNETLLSITLDDFKGLFVKDFPYLPLWSSSSFYNTDEEVYYSVNRLFYKALNDGVTSIPTTALDWIKYTDSINNYIIDSEIEEAFNEAGCVFNTSLWANDEVMKKAFLYLVAHYLCLDARTGRQGIESFGEFAVSSRSVGDVSESYSIPDKYLSDPVLSYYTKTGYGLKYLSMLIPALRGNVACIFGWSQAL